MKKIQTRVYPQYLYIAEEQDGTVQWYNVDPLKAGKNELARVDPGKLLVDMLGHCTKANPIIVQLGGYAYERSFSFDASIPAQMRKGAIAAHIRDCEGHYVEILPMRSTDPDFPFNGAVMEESGEPVAFRKYSYRGACSDGEKSHALIVFHGIFQMDSKLDLEGMAAEAEKKEQAEEPRKPRRRARRREETEEEFTLLGGSENGDDEGDGGMPPIDIDNL